MATRRTISSAQLGLINSDGPLDEGWWQCRGIFTGPYLRQQFWNTELIPAASDVKSLHETLRTRWLDNLPGLQRRNEA